MILFSRLICFLLLSLLLLSITLFFALTDKEGEAPTKNLDPRTSVDAAVRTGVTFIVE